MTTENLNPMERVNINDVQQMGDLVTGWHRDALIKTAQYAQMASEGGILIPTEELDENGEQVLKDANADHNEGFLVGMQTCLEILGTFPIKRHSEVSEDEPSE